MRRRVIVEKYYELAIDCERLQGILGPSHPEGINKELDTKYLDLKKKTEEMENHVA
jgi:hypothetical protein